jgi:putative transposase
MGRRLRPQLPGVPFHLTARVQGREPVFRNHERFVVSRILDTQRRSDAALLAYAVMPNHLHVVILQKRQPIGEFMQPLLRRIALLVQHRLGREGHVFERRFHSSPCLDPDYFRNAIAYVHLNGVRAGLCTNVDHYEWCSHASYLSLADDHSRSMHVPMENGLRLFASREGQSLNECRDDYCAFLEWRCAMDAHLAACETERPTLRPEPPCTLGGDMHWHRYYASATLQMTLPPGRSRPDLRDIARATLDDVAPDMELEQLRSGDRAKAVVRVRRRFILRALEAGHQGWIVARFVGISPSAVSTVLTQSKHEGR